MAVVVMEVVELLVVGEVVVWGTVVPRRNGGQCRRESIVSRGRLGRLEDVGQRRTGHGSLAPVPNFVPSFSWLPIFFCLAGA